MILYPYLLEGRRYVGVRLVLMCLRWSGRSFRRGCPARLVLVFTINTTAVAVGG